MTAIIILVILGIILVVAELVLPGGVLGIIGALCLLVAVGMSFKQGPVVGLSMFLAVCIFGLVMTCLWMKYFRSLPLTRSLVLEEEIHDTSEADALNLLVGQVGFAVTDIAPSGHAEINDQKYDVMSESGSIEKSAKVKVVDTRGPSIFVEQI